MRKKPTMLMILDGYGQNPDTRGNAVAAAHTPHIDALFQAYPHTTLGASGLSVGLPEGQMGNSEVGHLNIGAGRIVYQELTRITKSIQDGDFFENPAFLKAVSHVKAHDSALHIMGLLSDGGVHSHISHLFALIQLAKKHGLKKVYIHAFLDGRDVPPKSAGIFLKSLEEELNRQNTGVIATICGRYYAMDRDNRFERVQLAYDALTLGAGELAACPEEGLSSAYAQEMTDEFVKPIILTDALGKPRGLVCEHDAIIMFNFRPDRAREITRCFVDPGFSGFQRDESFQDLCYVCMTQYDAAMPRVLLAYPPEHLTNTLGEYLSKQGLTQLRIAETEKYAHVTFFFNGGVEEPNKGEDRILIPSPKVATYDQKPEMSAFEVTQAVLEEIEKDHYDVIILNFANPDMVGHTGVFSAAVAALEALDQCVGKIFKAVSEKDGLILLTADHGNCDCMLDKEENPVTAHSLNPVPFLISSKAPLSLRKDGVLADIAPTMLELLELPQPKEMTGRSLIQK